VDVVTLLVVLNSQGKDGYSQVHECEKQDLDIEEI